MRWRPSALLVPAALAAALAGCMAPRQEFFIPLPGAAPWDAIPAEGTAHLRLPSAAGARLQVRLAESEAGCVQAIVSAEAGRLALDLREVKVNGAAPARIESRRLPDAPEAAAPVQTLEPGTLYLLTYALPAQAVVEASLALPLAAAPARFVPQGVSRTDERRCR